MKVGILAGGLGTRFSEETEWRPKPMIEIGGHPILWHIMTHYAHFGHREFVVACGYKGDYIKRWFHDAVATTGNLTVDFKAGEVRTHEDGDQGLDWSVDLIDTGLPTATGGRIKQLQPYLGDETCMMTWGDGVTDLDVNTLLAFHRSHGKLCTVTAARPAARFGRLEIEGDQVVDFSEKPQTGEGWINGAFFVFEPGVFDFIDGDHTMFEREPLQRLARKGQLMAYRHEGFWQCMDTLRDKKLLDELWESGAPWRLDGERG